MLEVLGATVLIITASTSVGGWIYAIHKNGKESGRLETTIRQNNSVLQKLPCQANPNYGREWGILMEKVTSSERRLEKIESAIDEIRKNGKRA